MKHLLPIGLVIFLAACSKQDKLIDQPAEQQSKEKQICDFGIKDFNLTKRAPIVEEIPTASRKPRSGGGGGGGNPPPPATVAGVILLDFNGDVVSNTVWNTYGPINCAPANLTSTDITSIIDRVTNDFSPFNIAITTDEAVYNAAPVNRRQKVIITESWEWFGQAGGVSFTGSFSGSTYTPCFVFSSLLNYSTKKIAEALSHETGHTLGLRHHSVYDANCVKTSEYNYGQGSGETGWAPIMGVAYNQNLSLWHKGPNSLGCTTIQDDEAVIAALVGYKNDDHTNSLTGATTLSSSANGIIHNPTDVDMFQVILNSQRTVTLTPFSVDPTRAGANVDMILRIYNNQGTLLQTIDHVGMLPSSISLAAGTYYLSAGNVANANVGNYGMVGKYNISVE